MASPFCHGLTTAHRQLVTFSSLPSVDFRFGFSPEPALVRPHPGESAALLVGYSAFRNPPSAIAQPMGLSIHYSLPLTTHSGAVTEPTIRELHAAGSPSVQSPVFAHPRFEHLEAEAAAQHDKLLAAIVRNPLGTGAHPAAPWRTASSARHPPDLLHPNCFKLP